MSDGLGDARALLPGVRLDAAGELRGSDRSVVRRARATWPEQPATSVIVKSFGRAGEGWVRESAALEVAGPAAPVPVLVAAGASPPVIVMGDLGDGPNVADALLGDHAEAAAAAVLSWARALGRLHVATLASRGAFAAALAARAGDLAVPDATVGAALDDAARELEPYCARLGVDIPPGALAELRRLAVRLGGDGPAALSPADACPDNNVGLGEELALLDFEGATWRHVAWDVAYLTVPWPSCWCSWRMPGEVAERALEHYRSTVDEALPYVRTPEFRQDVAAAAAGWALISTTSFLPRALADDPPPSDPSKLTPTRRAMILHRLDGARRTTELPAVAELASRLRAVLAGRWGEVPLAFAPAFQDDA